MKKITKNDTKYIVTDNMEIVPCVELGETADIFGPKIRVGLRPEWVDKNSFTCSSSRVVSHFDLFDTYDEAERNVLDKKIEKLKYAFIVERDRWSKTCKYLSIFFYIFAALGLVQFVVGLFGK